MIDVNILFKIERIFRSIFSLSRDEDIRIKLTAANDCVNVYTTAMYYDERRHNELCAQGLQVMCIYHDKDGLLFTIDCAGII